jgi:SAM-dependent methyltransferase
MEAKMSHSSSGAPGWQLEGNAPLAYDTHIVDVFLQDYSRRLVEVAAIKPGDRVLDVASGTSVVTRLVANKIGSAGQVIGFDLNAGMLARARVSRETAAAIEWRVGSATNMPFADAAFDCVICQHGLQFMHILIEGVEGLAERAWPGRRLRIGEAVIGAKTRRGRCVMTTYDPDTLEQDPSVLRRVVRELGGRLGLDCDVIQGGRLAVGDRVELLAGERERAGALVPRSP